MDEAKFIGSGVVEIEFYKILATSLQVTMNGFLR